MLSMSTGNGNVTSPKPASGVPRAASGRAGATPGGRPPSARGTASAGVATPAAGTSTPRAPSPSGRNRKSSVNATNETIRKQIGGQLAGAPALPQLAERTNNPGRVRVALRVRPQIEQEIKDGVSCYTFTRMI